MVLGYLLFLEKKSIVIDLDKSARLQWMQQQAWLLILKVSYRIYFLFRNWLYFPSVCIFQKINKDTYWIRFFCSSVLWNAFRLLQHWSRTSLSWCPSTLTTFYLQSGWYLHTVLTCILLWKKELLLGQVYVVKEGTHELLHWTFP